MSRALVASFGATVRHLREGRGWSQEYLAERSDLNRSYVGEIERGSVSVSIVTAHKLAHALETDLVALFQGTEGARAPGT